MSTFTQKVLALVQKIPAGKVVTYQVLASALGNPKAFRAVGNSVHRNPELITTPCHRVVKSDGSIGGYVQGINKKIDLLRSEGVEVLNNKIDLDRYGVKL